MSVPAVAGHFDVIEFKLKDGCSLANYLQVVKDFNEWGKGHRYRTAIANKVQHSDLTTLLWIGRSANAAAFGKAWDNWRDAQAEATALVAAGRVALAGCHELEVVARDRIEPSTRGFSIGRGARFDAEKLKKRNAFPRKRPTNRFRALSPANLSLLHTVSELPMILGVPLPH